MIEDGARASLQAVVISCIEYARDPLSDFERWQFAKLRQIDP